MTVVHCEFRDCEYNEDLICNAGAIRLTPDACCTLYQPMDKLAEKKANIHDDRLTWDREYFEDDPSDGDPTF